MSTRVHEYSLFNSKYRVEFKNNAVYVEKLYNFAPL